MKTEIKTYAVSEQTAMFISALHEHGSKFYEASSNALASMYGNFSEMQSEFDSIYFQLTDMLEKCIVNSIAENQSNVNSNLI